MAMLGLQTQTAHVRVLGATEAPATVTLSPCELGGGRWFSDDHRHARRAGADRR